ncbi:MAG: SDR family NAD(P)-dependent oxidoreductase, partial [Chloroflexi bacterium]|nr:SDR family NAD(P)-dependent oxidoreductase [Chloroflexota bacterium]
MPGVLQGKVAIITGAGGGIGRAVALCLASYGARVIVNDPGVNIDGSGSSASAADKVVAEIRSRGGEALADYGSVALFSTGEALVRLAMDNFGRLDIVVTCAGILRDRMIYNMTEEEWDAVINVHLKGTFNVVRHACGVFRQQRSGRIITFTSESGLFGNAGQANYAAAKAGIVGLTKVVSRDMGRYGVTCNAVAPRAWTRMTMSGGEPQMRNLQKMWGFEPDGGDPKETTPWNPEDIAP